MSLSPIPVILSFIHSLSSLSFVCIATDHNFSLMGSRYSHTYKEEMIVSVSWILSLSLFTSSSPFLQQFSLHLYLLLLPCHSISYSEDIIHGYNPWHCLDRARIRMYGEEGIIREWRENQEDNNKLHIFSFSIPSFSLILVLSSSAIFRKNSFRVDYNVFPIPISFHTLSFNRSDAYPVKVYRHGQSLIQIKRNRIEWDCQWKGREREGSG